MNNVLKIAHRVADLTQPLMDRRDYGSDPYAKKRVVEWSKSDPGQKLLIELVSLQDMAEFTQYDKELDFLPETLESLIANAQGVLAFIKS